MKKIIVSSLGVLVLGVLLVGLLNHPVRVLANPFSPADTRVTPELRAAVEERHPGASIIDIELDLDGFDLYLSNGFVMEVGFFGRIDPITQTWDGRAVTNPTTVTTPVVPTRSDDIWLSPDQLPQNVLDFIAQTYPDLSIVIAEQDDDGYDITLSNGLDLEFRFDGSLERQDFDDDDDDVYISASSLPQVITDYLNTNYPTATIRYVEMDAREYNVYLDNGLELYFNLEGMLLEIERDDD